MMPSTDMSLKKTVGWSIRYGSHGKLRNGQDITIRAIRPDDKNRLDNMFHRMSKNSIYYRFFCAKQALSSQELSYYTDIDYIHHIGLVATVLHEDPEQIIGVGRYIESHDIDSIRSAEVAFAVDDTHQNLGVATLLLNHLVSIASVNGVQRFTAEMMPDNRQMVDVFERNGFILQRSFISGTIHARLDITGI